MYCGRKMSWNPFINGEAHNEDCQKTQQAVLHIPKPKRSGLVVLSKWARLPSPWPLVKIAPEPAHMHGDTSIISLGEGLIKKHVSAHSSDTPQTPYAMTVGALRKLNENLLIFKGIFGPGPGPDEDSTKTQCYKETLLQFSNHVDRHKVSKLTSNSLAEIKTCIKTLDERGNRRLPNSLLHGHLGHLLSAELKRASKNDKTMKHVSDYIASTFMPDGRSVRTSVNKTSALDHHGQRMKKDHDAFTATMAQYRVGSKDMDELSAIMSGVDTWGLDIFKLSDFCESRPLACLTYTLFDKYNMMEHFQIPPESLMTYICSVEENYLDMPYHNNLHAADVVHSTHILLQAGELQDMGFTKLEILAVIFGAAIHDVDHPGVTSKYLNNINHPLALMYNSDTVLERHHLNVGFRLLQNPNADIFENLNRQERHMLRKLVAEIVLATDMNKHTSLLAALKLNVESAKDKSKKNIKMAQRHEMLRGLIHCADLSNPSKPFDQYQKWVDRIMTEFWNQGDQELAQGLTISPMCDRRTANVAQSQVGFIDYIVYPLFSLWSDLVSPDVDDIMRTIVDNRNVYAGKAGIKLMKLPRPSNSAESIKKN